MTSSGIRQLSEDRLGGSLACSSSVLTDQPLSCPLPTHRPLPSSLKFRGSQAKGLSQVHMYYSILAAYLS